MWNCRSKLKLGGNVVFTRADGDVRAFCFRMSLLYGRVHHSVRTDFEKAKRRAEDCPPQ